MSSIIRRIILYTGTTVITVSALAMSIFAECISQKQRIAIDWNIQDILSNESIIALVVLCAVVSLVGLLLASKRASCRVKLAPIGIYSPIVFLLLSIFQGDILKSVIASILYFALFAEIVLVDVVEASNVISNANIKNQ